MNLKEILELNQINRNTYNSLERRAGLPFMKRGLVGGPQRDRYTFTHAVALAAVISFKELGIEARNATSAVDSIFDGLLIDWVATLLFTPEAMKADQCWVTISSYADGTVGWASGKEGADTFETEPPVTKLSVNVAVLVKELLKRREQMLAEQRASESELSLHLIAPAAVG